MRFELTNGTLGRYCLTTWRHPHGNLAEIHAVLLVNVLFWSREMKGIKLILRFPEQDHQLFGL